MDFSIITWDNLVFMIKGAGLSLEIALISCIAGIILGTIGAAMKISNSKILHAISTVYVEIFRGTPMLMQITFGYLALPSIIKLVFGKTIRFSAFVTGIFAISLNSGAYSTELIRSGILGVDKGQWEAADALGLTYWQKMTKVILPQAFKRIVPPMISEFITLVKDSSLLSSIGVVELMKTATTVGAKHYNYLAPLIVASAMYLFINIIISQLAKKLEKRLAASD